MSNAGPVLSLLRERTGGIHSRLEQRMNAVDRLAKHDTRRDLVQRYYRFHDTIETAVEPYAKDLGLSEWRRLPLIERSLAALGLLPLPSSTCSPLANREQALGALYVLNGSALGGRMILKDITRRGADHKGLDFLDPHGDALGDAWRTFVGVLESKVTDAGEAAAGALRAFGHAEHILCTERQCD